MPLRVEKNLSDVFLLYRFSPTGGASGCFQTPVCSTWQKKIKSSLDFTLTELGSSNLYSILAVLSTCLCNFLNFSVKWVGFGAIWW